MAIYLPGTADEEQLALDELTPREIVTELDKYVVGQKDAKRAVAIALRNRMRRQKLAPELAEEVIPKNIIMIGPTGVGKTEIARRLAKLANSPFLKVEASKFTEVGYVGRDVESMVRDLVEIAIDMIRGEKLEDVADKAELNAEERLLDILLPPSPASRPAESSASGGVVIDGGTGLTESSSRTREKLRQQLREGKLDDRMVEIETRERNFPSFEIISNQGVEEMDVNIKDMLPNIFGQRTKKRKMKVNEAFEYLIQEEEQRLIDMDQVTRVAVDRVENSGIIFLDEIDKIAGRESGHGPDVSREEMANSPFLKVEASKFTEVGYVGRDVESMIRDLVEIAIDMIRGEKLEDVADKAELNAEERLLDILLPPSPASRPAESSASGGVVIDGGTGLTESSSRTREKLRQQLREGKLDDRMVEIETRERNFPSFEIISNQGVEEMDVNIKDMLPNIFGQRTKKRKMKVNEAFEYLIQEEEQRLIDMDQVTRVAIDRVENSGIIFLDEIDKIAGRESGHGPDVSSEGVQRDILPIVEGTTVNTRYGMVRTDHILFIAAGAFHVSKPSDLIPELQGRFPIRVELQSLTMEDFIRILTEPKSSLTKQYIALLETEGVKLEFTPDALEEVARFAFRVNEGTENIGARRLHTIMERVLDEISFDAPEKKGQQFNVDAAYVQKMLSEIVKDQDLSRYIL